MFEYEFVEVPRSEELFKKDTISERLEELIKSKGKEGWELIQVIPHFLEKNQMHFIEKYTVIFKINDKKEINDTTTC